MEIVARGAEAVLYHEGNYLVKKRIKKGYRLDILDKDIRKFRTRREGRLMERAFHVIPVPNIFEVNERDMTIKMKFIKGDKLSETLDEYSDKKRTVVCKLIGKQVALLHNKDIIHGDLTTSTMILKKTKLYFIDFGLGFIDPKIEHKAVDLHLLKQALESKHYLHYINSFNSVLDEYRKYAKEGKQVLDRFDRVEERGRYKRKGL